MPASLVGPLSKDLDDARQLAACRTYLRAAADRYPENPFLHFYLFGACREIEPDGPHEALRHMAAACVLRPKSALFQLQLGACYEKLEAYDLAVDAYGKSIALYPESAMAYRYLGVALAKKRDEKGAMAAFQEAFRISPNDDLRCIRSTQRAWRRWAGQPRAFKRSLMLSPDFPPARTIRGFPSSTPRAPP